MTTNGSYEFKTTRRHDRYYITGGDAVFIVENIFFRVHRYFFERESVFFKDKFLLPASPGKERAGTSDTNAILLQDVKKKTRAKPWPEITASQFEAFLWVFYNPTYSLYDAPVDRWVNILDLADRWQFAEVKNLAVRELEKLVSIPLVDRIIIYQDYEVNLQVLLDRYVELAVREEPIGPDIAERIGWKIALQLQNSRETALRMERTCISPADVSPMNMRAIIEQTIDDRPPILSPLTLTNGKPPGTSSRSSFSVFEPENGTGPFSAGAPASRTHNSHPPSASGNVPPFEPSNSATPFSPSAASSQPHDDPQQSASWSGPTSGQGNGVSPISASTWASQPHEDPAHIASERASGPGMKVDTNWKARTGKKAGKNGA